MLDIEKLRQEREKTFDAWFEKWWEKEGLENKIEEYNWKGRTSLVVALSDYDVEEQRWMHKRAFLSKLQDMLPDFGVNFKYTKNIFTNRDFLYGIKIDWAVSRSEDL